MNKEPTEPVSFSSLERRPENPPARMDAGTILELVMGATLIGATTLAAVIPLLELTHHPIGLAMIAASLSFAALCGALARDLGDD